MTRRVLAWTKDDFAALLERALSALAESKPEFRGVEFSRITGWSAAAPDRPLVFCGEEHFEGLLNEIGLRAAIPVVVVVEEYDATALDRVFRQGYMHLVGVLRERLGDPEDTGAMVRLVKDQLRHIIGGTGAAEAVKPIDWKVSVPAPDAYRPFVSLFADDAMREFMQRLIFAVRNVEMEGLPRLRDRQSLMQAYAQLGRALEQKDGGVFGGIEADVKSLVPEPSDQRPGAILLQGESGTGKTLVVEWIRRFLSRRAPGDPIPYQRIGTVNIGTNILESELFGSVAGAWTGSVSRLPRLLLAAGGVVFLDEIGDLPPETQAKLLLYLDEMAFTPDGWPYDWKIPAPAYVIAATNRNLDSAVAEGSFRADLFHRFRYHLRIPPLRERRHDLRPLISLVLQNPTINPDKRVQEITLDAIARLEAHEYRGNFRELERVLADAVFRALQSGRTRLTAADLGLPC